MSNNAIHGFDHRWHQLGILAHWQTRVTQQHADFHEAALCSSIGYLHTGSQSAFQPLPKWAPQCTHGKRTALFMPIRTAAPSSEVQCFNILAFTYCFFPNSPDYISFFFPPCPDFFSSLQTTSSPKIALGMVPNNSEILSYHHWNNLLPEHAQFEGLNIHSLSKE